MKPVTASKGEACLPCKGPALDLVDAAKPQPRVDLSVIVSKRKMFSGVILLSAPKEREWNL
jgi:hypothetical protein